MFLVRGKRSSTETFQYYRSNYLSNYYVVKPSSATLDVMVKKDRVQYCKQFSSAFLGRHLKTVLWLYSNNSVMGDNAHTASGVLRPEFRRGGGRLIFK